MEMSPDQVLQALREITSRLDSEGIEEAERAELMERRETLRAHARDNHVALNNPALLQQELKHLRQRLTALDRERVQIPKWQKYTGGYLTDPAASGHEINRKLDNFNADARAALERRVAEIEAVLGGDGPA